MMFDTNALLKKAQKYEEVQEEEQVDEFGLPYEYDEQGNRIVYDEDGEVLGYEDENGEFHDYDEPQGDIVSNTIETAKTAASGYKKAFDKVKGWFGFGKKKKKKKSEPVPAPVQASEPVKLKKAKPEPRKFAKKELDQLNSADENQAEDVVQIKKIPLAALPVLRSVRSLRSQSE
jgi:hypothetical protein